MKERKIEAATGDQRREGSLAASDQKVASTGVYRAMTRRIILLRCPAQDHSPKSTCGIRNLTATWEPVKIACSRNMRSVVCFIKYLNVHVYEQELPTHSWTYSTIKKMHRRVSGRTATGH